MGLPAYAPELHAPAERLHYFHPFRIGVATLFIVGGYIGLVLWLGGRSAGTQARTAILVPVLLFAVGRTFQPRTLSADATEIRWKKMFQPAQTVPRHDAVAIQYLTTARPGAPRYYFVNRDGNAVLWVDRFTPLRMGSFASYLGIPMRPVSVAPSRNTGADAAVAANAVVGERRSTMFWMGVCAVIGLVFTVGAAIWAHYSGAEFAAYERAPLCQQASADPSACRFETPAVVTDWTAKGRIDLRFPADVPTIHRRTTSVRLTSGAPDPPFAVGDTVKIEVFDGHLMRINGAITDEFTTLESNASWLLVAAAGLFFLGLPILGILLAWKGSTSWFVSQTPPAPPSKSILDNPPAVTDQPGPKVKPGAIERVLVRDPGDGDGDAWPTLIEVPNFDYVRFEENLSATGIPSSGERLLAKASIHYYGVPGTSSILLLTDRRLVILGRTRLEIPRARISLLAYWKFRDSIAITYQTMSGPHGILLTGPQLVWTGGPKTDMYRLFMTMQTALSNPDRIRDPLVIVRPVGAGGRRRKASGRLTHRLLPGSVRATTPIVI